MGLNIKAICIFVVSVAVFDPLTAVCVENTLTSRSGKFSQIIMRGAQTISSMEVLEKDSDVPCIKDWTYGFGIGNVWVHRNCSANFEICYEKGIDELLECDSEKLGYKQCDTTVSRIFKVDLVIHNSKYPCIPVFSYGLSDNRVWVDKGCDATFHVMGS